MLEGLKEIAGELSRTWEREVSVWTVWRAIESHEDPLPAYRVRRRVYAKAEAVKAWADKQQIWRRAP